MNRILLLRSACAVNEAYLDEVKNSMERLDLQADIKESQDSDLWKAYGLDS